MILIAEIGNNHFGDVNKAKELIVLAKKSGASIVKMQAIDSSFKGSMPVEFYKECAFSTETYLSLLEFARFVEIELFYTVVSSKHTKLFSHQIYHKISGAMSSAIHNYKNTQKNGGDVSAMKIFGDASFWHSQNVFMSVKEQDFSVIPDFPFWSILYVSEYLTKDPKLENLTKLKKLIKPWQVFGYSDHTIGIHACQAAIEDYGCQIIEKHFTDEKNKKWKNLIFRDTVHAADPKELKELSKLMKRRKHG